MKYRMAVRIEILLTLALVCGGWAARPAVADDSLSALEEQAIKAAVERVAPSVVRIETVGGLERLGQMLVGTGPTTGLIVSADGYIVSSAFSFAQKPDSILVTLPGGKRQAAQLVATDHSRLLVLLKVESEEELVPAVAVPEKEIHVGQWAIAVGRVFEAERPNASVGIVSAVGRIWGKAIQTDAKISPNNYGGPLVDIAGRVMGVLVPMSPQGAGSEVAGVEWYDSGIGFAVPLENVLRVLPQLREGQELHSGMLGISMKGSDLFGTAATIAAAAATGPAYKAGFRVGDTIVEINGQSVASEAQLKHALGPHYAGESVTVVALRGDERIEHELQLVEKVEPYEAPFLGILPKRLLGENAATDADAKTDAKTAETKAEEEGVTVRYVYPGSPAANLGILPGDRLIGLAGGAIHSAGDLSEALRLLAPEETVELQVVRGEQTQTYRTTLGHLPESLPAELPPAYDAEQVPPLSDDRPAVGAVPLKLPEFENECLVYVPEDYNPAVPHGLVVWLHAPGGEDQEALVERWKPLCEKYDLILLAPKSADPTKWQPTEVRFVQRVLEATLKNYAIDPARVAVHGHQGGATLAYLIGLLNQDKVRAVAAVDAPLPRVSKLPQSDPLRRMAFFTTLSPGSASAEATEAGVKKLREMKYPVVVQDVGSEPRYLNAEELEALARWFDSLDRF